MNRYKKSGWFNESQRHSLARKGIKTGRKDAVSFAMDKYLLNDNGKSVSNIEDVRKKITSLKNTIKENVDVALVRGFALKDLEVIEKYIEKTKSSKTNYSKTDFARVSQPQHILQAPLPDTDKDGVPDITDWDDDNDGVPDWKDSEGLFDIGNQHGEGVFDPFHESQKDSDLDGVPDYKDLHPENPFKKRDWARKGINSVGWLEIRSDGIYKHKGFKKGKYARVIKTTAPNKSVSYSVHRIGKRWTRPFIVRRNLSEKEATKLFNEIKNKKF